MTSDVCKQRVYDPAGNDKIRLVRIYLSYNSTGTYRNNTIAVCYYHYCCCRTSVLVFWPIPRRCQDTVAARAFGEIKIYKDDSYKHECYYTYYIVYIILLYSRGIRSIGIRNENE